MQAAVGGNVRYPSLNAICNLFRSKINDTANNTTGTGTGTGNTAGLIMPNSNPDLLEFLNSAVEELYSDLRNVGDPELILDNYDLIGIPPLANPDPTVQVSLAYSGYFNGFSWSNQWALPIGTTKVLAMWERESNTNLDFQPMRYAPFGIPGAMQGTRMGLWETRQGQIWMAGALQTVDLRLRVRITYPPFLNSSTLNFSTAYVPILDSRNAIVAKMLVQYGERFAPEQVAAATIRSEYYLDKLRLEVVRQLQAAENQRSEFGNEAVQDFAVAWSWL